MELEEISLETIQEQVEHRRAIYGREKIDLKHILNDLIRHSRQVESRITRISEAERSIDKLLELIKFDDNVLNKSSSERMRNWRVVAKK